MHTATAKIGGMASFTTNDLAAINAAIASGELTIRAADGKLVTLRSLSDLMQARQAIMAEIASTSTPVAARRFGPRVLLADFRE